jgi:hypothetical protein
MRSNKATNGIFGVGLLALFGVLLASTPSFATTSLEVYPTGLTFNPQTSGTVSAPLTVTVYNLGTTSGTVTAVTSSTSQFVVTGTVPVTIQPSQSANFTVTFKPNSAKTFSATLTVSITGQKAQKVTLGGLGTSTTAVGSLNTTSLTFASQNLGSTSPSQAVTITNTGTTSFKLSNVTLTYPFSQTGFSGTAITIAAGKSLTLQVSFFPTATGTTNGTMLLTYDSIAPEGVSLSGTGATPSSLALTTYRTLPSATQNFAYQATLTAQGGASPYTWSLASGSSLPSGLSLSSSGLITGTLASTVAKGNYSFTATATDSNASAVSAVLTLPVFAATGSNCNNIIFNAGDGSGPLVPINDLGTGSYLGAEEGGLYANGSNVRPSGQDASGVSLAQGIQPLDSNGNPSPTGKYVFISIGESIAQQPFTEFVTLANADPGKNPSLVVVDGATGGATASRLSSIEDNFWSVIMNNYLPNAGVTAKQVVVAWVNDVNGGPSGSFPSDMTTLQANYESVTQNLLTEFPNIKLAYFSSINYAGYSNGLQNLSNEPWSYESGFAVKNAIQDQINGNANLNFNSLNGPVLAPWMSWGPYYWANGLIARSDGLEWTCQDLQADGTHPSLTVGRIKVATQLLNFLKSDDTASIWFLAH